MSAEKTTLLVIDDSPLDTSVLAEILKAEHHVLGATSSEAALGVLHSGKLPDLIVLDVMMPGIGGLQFASTDQAGRLSGVTGLPGRPHRRRRYSSLLKRPFPQGIRSP